MDSKKIEDTLANIVEKITSLDVRFDIIFDLAQKSEPGNFYIAGGVVRDAFISDELPIKDIDLFVSDLGYTAIEEYISNNGVKTYNQFHSVRWYPFEGKDFYYDIMKISDFKPGLWSCDDIIDVLNQFDYTANALAYDLNSSTFFNPLNGLKHIFRKEFRAVRFDYPEIDVSDSIKLSRLSVLYFRYKYYSAKLNFKIEPITLQWVQNNSFRETDEKIFKHYFFDPNRNLT